MCRFPHASLLALVCALGVMLPPAPAPASETDNYSLPLDAEMADLGDFLETLHTRAIEESVRRVNSRIEQALNLKDPARRDRALAECHAPDRIAKEIAARFGDPLTEVTRFESALRGSRVRQAFPGTIPLHMDKSLSLRGHFPLDPRILGTLSYSGTIRAYGVYFGTDKILHLHQLGYGYYKRYRELLRQGLTPAAATQAVVNHFADHTFFAENKFFGTIITGIYSNGDMAANYAGLKFYLNLTEPIRFRSRQSEPLVVRSGVFWRVNDQVWPGSGWFRLFVSDHLNEALNPNVYDWTMHERVRRFLENRAEHIVAFYTVKDGRPREAAYFDQLARDLATFDGEAYGHSGEVEKLLTLGNTCFPAIKKR